MMKKLIVVLFSLLFTFVLSSRLQPVRAGGCCYLDYNIKPGTANKESAKITTAFTDPNDTYTDSSDTKLKPITGKKVSLQIYQPTPGADCHMLSDEMNADGQISAECNYDKPGDVFITFSIADNPGGVNEILSTVPMKMPFDGVAVVDTPILVTPVSHTPSHPHLYPSATPVVISTPQPAETPQATVTDDEKGMQDRISQLEHEVASQKQQVSGLQAMVERLFASIANLFHFGR